MKTEQKAEEVKDMVNWCPCCGAQGDENGQTCECTEQDFFMDWFYKD